MSTCIQNVENETGATFTESLILLVFISIASLAVLAPSVGPTRSSLGNQSEEVFISAANGLNVNFESPEFPPQYATSIIGTTVAGGNAAGASNSSSSAAGSTTTSNSTSWGGGSVGTAAEPPQAADDNTTGNWLN